MRLLVLLFLIGCQQPRGGGGDGFDDPPPCGDGTIEVDGECVGLDDGLECGDGTIELAGECVSTELQWVSLPMVEGYEAMMGQTFHGFFSHQDKGRYAVDIPMAIGTPVAAMRGGTVVDLKEDSDTGCGTSDCADDGNFVKIDHGDGTFAIYFHLEFQGATVDVGDGVCAGEVVGYSGNTGWSTGPHLHIAVQNALAISLPLRFFELADSNGGVPAPGQVVMSANAEDTDCAPPSPSDCPEDLFAHMGARLDPGVPCGLAEKDVVYPATGHVSHGAGVVIGTWRLDLINGGEGWSYQCWESDADGNFEGEVLFPSEVTTDRSWLIIGAAEPDCTTFAGWAYSARIRLW